MVGGRAFGDGDAAFRNNAGRDDRAGLFGRNAVYPILLWIAAGNDNFMRHGSSVFLQGESLYGLRIFGKTF